MNKSECKLQNVEIENILREEYNINSKSIEEINRGTADIYKIKSDDGEYVLKRFSEGRTKESVIKETEIIEFLNKKGIRVPVYIKTKEDKFYTIYEGRTIVLQEFIDGYTMENNTGDYSKTMESANILGKLVKALKDYKGLSDENIIEKKFSLNAVKNGIEKMKDLQKKLNPDNPYKEQFDEDLKFKINVAEDFEINFNFDIVNKLTMSNSHGDYSVQQLIYNDNKETAVIDFETAQTMPIVWEVMRSYSYVDSYAKNGELNVDTLVDYFKEFNKYVKLNQYDLKYAAHVYLLQLVPSAFGYKQYNDDYDKKGLLEFALFRTKLCKSLEKNKQIIGQRLENEIK